MAYRSFYPIANGIPEIINGVSQTPFPIITANGNYPADPNGVDFQGGMGSFEAFGNFGGGTATLQIRGIDAATWINFSTAAVLTADGIVGFYAPKSRMRLVLTGSTAPSLKASLRQIEGA